MPENESNGILDELAGIVPPRDDVEIPEPGVEVGLGEIGGSLRQRMNLSPKLTDMQTADKRLFPAVKIEEEVIEWLSNIQVSRIFPDVYSHYRNLIAKHIIST